MANNHLILIYKEVGKEPEFKKVENKLEILESLVGGELDFIPYEEITIIARKNRDNLRPNIYVNTNFLGIGTSIRGTVIIVLKKDENIKSVTKEQAIKYRDFLIRASFKYDHFDENGKYISNRKRKKDKLKKQKELSLEREKIDNKIQEEGSELELGTDEMIKMIFAMQTVILKFIKNYVE